jgi:hypothetical protein
MIRTKQREWIILNAVDSRRKKKTWKKRGGGGECRNRAKKSLRQKKWQWSWEREYEKGQDIRMSQEYGMCRNARGVQTDMSWCSWER